MEKTIFVTIGNGLMARNISTSGVLKRIAQRGKCRIVVLVPNIRETKPPKDLLYGIEGENIEVVIVPNLKPSSLEHNYHKFVEQLTFTKSTKMRLRYYSDESKRMSTLAYMFCVLIFTPLSKLTFLKKAIRIFDLHFFTTDLYDSYFEKYKPSVVFATSMISTKFDLPLLKEAKRRNIKTVAMTKSWDNLDKQFFRMEPDLFLIQGEAMRESVLKYQVLPPENVRVVGFPQFDMYQDKSLILSREKYCASKGFDPELPILFFGSEGHWTRLRDTKIFKAVIEARNRGELPMCNILIRPHYSALNESDFSQLGKEERVFIDDTFHQEPFFNDNWNLTKEDMIDFMNSLHHMNVMVMFASTLTLDAACFDKPIIGVAYGTMYAHGKDVSLVRFKTTHFQWVLDKDAILLACSESELVDTINKSLEDPARKQKGRRALLDYIADGACGKSVDKVAEEVLTIRTN